MPKLYIIIGDAGVGKTTHAKIQCHGKKYKRILADQLSLSRLCIGQPDIEGIEYLIIDECHSEEQIRMIISLWDIKRVLAYSSKTNRVKKIKVPDLIAIFQTENISEDWKDLFRKRGAYITTIVSRKEVSNG